MSIQMIPLEKVVIDGVLISFGMKRDAVENAIGRGERVDDRYYYKNGELAIAYDREKRVEFVEFLGGIDGTLRPEIDGISVFEADADAFAAWLKEKNGGEWMDAERGYSYQFEKISVGVYRETTPTDVTEMIAEMQADGIPTEGNEDVAEEMRKAMHWATVGAGVAGYYRR